MIRSKATQVSKIKPYSTSNLRHNSKYKNTNMDMEILNLNLDMEDDLLKTDSESSQSTVVSIGCSENKALPSVQIARDELMDLLKEIRDSQSSLCTKSDLHDYSQTMKRKFSEMDKRVTTNTSTINTVASKISSIESSLELNKHDLELVKQNAISSNLSIMGIPMTENEDLTSIATKLFLLVGCKVTKADISGCYRINTRNSSLNIFIVKLKDFAVKHRILKSKVNKELRLGDVIKSNSINENPNIFINNHVTPFFGKLLAEGRKAVKEKSIHSVWLSRSGCRLRFDIDGDEYTYRSINELNALLTTNCKQSTSRQAAKHSKRSKPDDIEISPNVTQKSKK